VQRGHLLLEDLDLEQSALVLVMSPPGIGPAALRRLAVTEIQRYFAPFGGAAVSPQSEHGEPPWLLVAWPLRRVNVCLSLRNIG
jgi:hypothetical protein